MVIASFERATQIETEKDWSNTFFLSFFILFRVCFVGSKCVVVVVIASFERATQIETEKDWSNTFFLSFVCFVSVL